MMRVDEQFMEEVGLGAMPEAEKQEFMKHAQEELEVRFGQGIGANLSEAQMAEFEGVTDLDAAAAWLDQNAPNFREVAAKVFEEFKKELAAERESILGM